MEVTVVVFYGEEPIEGEGYILAFASPQSARDYLKGIGYMKDNFITARWFLAGTEWGADLYTVEVKEHHPTLAEEEKCNER